MITTDGVPLSPIETITKDNILIAKGFPESYDMVDWSLLFRDVKTEKKCFFSGLFIKLRYHWNNFCIKSTGYSK